MKPSILISTLLSLSFFTNGQYLIINKLSKSANAKESFELLVNNEVLGTLDVAQNRGADNYSEKWHGYKLTSPAKKIAIQNKKLEFYEELQSNGKGNIYMIFDPSLPMSNEGIVSLSFGNWKEGTRLMRISKWVKTENCTKDELFVLEPNTFYDGLETVVSQKNTQKNTTQTVVQTQNQPVNNIPQQPEKQRDSERIVISETASSSIGYMYEKKSDVDIIEKNNLSKQNRIALIIGNEDYKTYQMDLSSESNVDYAMNDAHAFKEYCTKLLGISQDRIIFVTNATSAKMRQAVAKTNLLIKTLEGEADVFVFYAGHGLPDEVSKEPYLIPVDVSGKNPSDGIKLKDFYTKLTEFPSKKVTVFIDACFSGGARNQGLIAARGVKVKATEQKLNGNLVVFSASNGEQSSLPYKDKKHGMFTYFLLKKIKESGGNISYKNLYDAVRKEVSINSLTINDKEQTPQMLMSDDVINTIENYNLSK